jgi:hypothetical protein
MLEMLGATNGYVLVQTHKESHCYFKIHTFVRRKNDMVVLILLKFFLKDCGLSLEFLEDPS